MKVETRRGKWRNEMRVTGGVAYQSLTGRRDKKM